MLTLVPVSRLSVLPLLSSSMSLLRLASAAALRSPLRAAPAAVRSSCVRVVAPAVASSFVSAASFHWSAARPAAAASAASSSPVNPIKYTTNLAGIDVVPNAREVLMGLLQETIAAIAAYNKQHGVRAHTHSQKRTHDQTNHPSLSLSASGRVAHRLFFLLLRVVCSPCVSSLSLCSTLVFASSLSTV